MATLEEDFEKVLKLLGDADCELQRLLPDSMSSKCYSLHNQIDLLIADVEEVANKVVEEAAIQPAVNQIIHFRGFDDDEDGTLVSQEISEEEFDKRSVFMGWPVTMTRQDENTIIMTVSK